MKLHLKPLLLACALALPPALLVAPSLSHALADNSAISTTASDAVAAARQHGQLIDLPGGKLWVDDAGGKGAPVIFMHAGSGTGALFSKYQRDVFTKAGYRYISYDRSGVGLSPASPSKTGDDELLLQLLDKLAIKRAHLVAVAAGGGLGLKFLLAHPDRVASIVLANSLGSVSDKSYQEMGDRIRPRAAWGAMPVEMQELSPSYRAVNEEGVKLWLALGRHDRMAPPPAAASNTSQAPAAQGPGAAGGPAGGAQPITFAVLETVKTPTLLLTGDADGYTPPSVLRLFKTHMKSADLVIVPETGHASFWENPSVFNRVVLNFLKKVK
jgi:pimeloyl-ACP methyl ester carboxylesterase